MPATVERLLTGAPGGLPADMTAGVERADSVAVVLLDAFGMRFVERHADHPLLRRLDAIRPLASQFPSTTTAHVTTMHAGMPVGEHGLYEWIVYEPAYGDVITPILFSAAELFPGAGPRLRARMADVCVLPAPGRMAWLRAHRSVESRFRGHHGGMTPEESQTWLGAMILP